VTRIDATTIINASVETVFSYSLSIDLELSAASNYSIRAIDGVTSGNIGPGQRVTWQVRQFGVWLTHTTEITAFKEPSYFQDSMVDGLFHSFSHDHFFSLLPTGQTEMRDEMNFSMPILLTGKLAETLFVRRRLTSLLDKRNQAIKKEAEASGKR
jgi:ligand-binding SRPBCC domain-containing protein